MAIALATAAALPGLFADDRLLLAALRARGLAAEPVIWEDRHHAWDRAELVVIRSTWDYSWRRDAFLAWADAMPPGRLWNPASVVRWNTHKSYLLDLAARDVPVVPTRLLPAGQGADLAGLLAETGWASAVLKPAVGQSGRYALPVTAADPGPGQAHLDRLLSTEDMLLQPLVASVATEGEWSLTFVEGQCTHGVRKRAAAGDFRVHDDYGGSVIREDAAPEALAVARAALAAVGEPLLYGRVDLVADSAGRPVVMELELVEPELFFAHAPGTAEVLAAAIARRC